MGLWQMASLANVFKCPVVSVCPRYGTNNTRIDMHRVFYPFHDFVEKQPVFVMWTAINGIPTERDFVLNHFTALMPFDEEFYISDSVNSPIANSLLDDLDYLMFDYTDSNSR